MVEEFSPQELYLSGYVAFQETGFALPCFASSENSNSWYTAECSVPTDHSGIITGFQVYRATDVKLLPTDQVRQIRIGGPWCDVFLWRGDAFVGYPSELWDSLKSQQSAIEAEAPLSLLDLSLFGADTSATSVAKSAFEFVSNRLDDARARQWRRNLLIRPIVVRSVLRAIFDGRLPAPTSSTREINVVDTDETTCGVQIPEALREKIKAADLADEILAEARRIAHALSIDIHSEIDDGLADENLDTFLGAEVLGEQLEEIDNAQGADKKRRAADILIVLCGRSAERMAKYFRSPDWYPGWEPNDTNVDDAEAQYDVVIGRRDPSERGVIHLVEPQEVPIDVTRYGVAIFVGEEGDLLEAVWSLEQTGSVAHFSLASECVVLLAPILPSDRPIDGLERFNSRPGAVKRTYDAIVDTALVRSPLRHRGHRGNAHTRMAELVVGAALLCKGKNQLTRFLRSRKRDVLVVLAFGLEAQNKMPTENRLDLASENTWGSDRRHSRSILFSSSFDVKSHLKKRSLRGYVEVRQRRADFADFSEYVIKTFALPIFSHDRQFRPAIIANLRVPQDILSKLDFPKFASGFELNSGELKQQIVVTAETPKLSALTAASAEGWQVVRYTDANAILDILSGQVSYRGGGIPFELKLPRIRRLPENQNLFSRGIAKADLILLDPRDRSSVDLTSFQRMNGIPKYLVPSLEDETDPPVVVPRMIKELPSVGIDFGADLLRPLRGESAWQRPPPGATRFAFANGILPLQLMELSEDQVPLSSVYYIDGTEAAVRSLLQSRVFYVWLRATGDYRIGASFPLRRSLETFPIVPPFVVEGSRQYRPYLLLEGGDRSMSRLARELEALPSAASERLRRRKVSPYQFMSSPPRKALDDAVLAAYGLRERATDLEVLTRLMEVNDRLGFGQVSPGYRNALF
ncbi:hypothetical protein [Reyranella massiliensis]|uniref:hypothetical protein n=1 Tax=Reyranella massiliensis TaxID=445220 RepID=UPI000309202A|nr:hypothetical protein [Reyranella massiliensis]